MQRIAAGVLSVVMWAFVFGMVSFLNADFLTQSNGWRIHLLPTAFGGVLGFLLFLWHEGQKDTQTALQRTAATLSERVKELNCLYALSSLAEQRREM